MSIKIEVCPSYHPKEIAKILKTIADWIEASNNKSIQISLEITLK
jgi:hypothetical protein